MFSWNYQESEIHETARKLLDLFPNEKIWTFSGELGAGKTALIRAICSQLGVKQLVQSPTFSIVLTYQSPTELIFHFDCYRLGNAEEFFSLGGSEYLYSGNYCLIEWAENISDAFNTEVLNIQLDWITEKERKITAGYKKLS
ncbi:MAG: tRNA (adenosine(37)-N6)-threonylcarbamoyltransferase complex ATPase subunit type 1 TsaE [Bacteroidia bacterium]|nr:tRNA (adenosine(37)-N6)-threonylcarbamoyltransferase complex ATPase subunit type 1 TsaE [Bacteroidia bacterium]